MVAPANGKHQTPTNILKLNVRAVIEKVSGFDQKMPQSQTADKPWHREEEPHNNHDTPGRQTKQSNQLSIPHQECCKTRMDIK